MIEKEDEFAGRDSKGLQDTKGKTKSEASQRSHYFGVFGKLVFLQAPAIAWSVYFLSKYVLGMSDSLEEKFAFMHKYQLGYVYLAWFLVFLTRIYASINCNGAREPTRLDRPDQHIYKIMAREGELKSAPYVLMATTGAAGRYNRATRAAANIDETLPTFLAGILLQALVFGPVAVVVAGLYMYGRIKFCNGYKQSLAGRMAGFMPAIVAEHVSAALVGVCAIKGILYGVVPF